MSEPFIIYRFRMGESKQQERRPFRPVCRYCGFDMAPDKVRRYGLMISDGNVFFHLMCLKNAVDVYNDEHARRLLSQLRRRMAGA